MKHQNPIRLIRILSHKGGANSSHSRLVTLKRPLIFFSKPCFEKKTYQKGHQNPFVEKNVEVPSPIRFAEKLPQDPLSQVQ